MPMNTAMVPVVCAIDLPTKRSNSLPLKPYLQATGEGGDDRCAAVAKGRDDKSLRVWRGSAKNMLLHVPRHTRTCTCVHALCHSDRLFCKWLHEAVCKMLGLSDSPESSKATEYRSRAHSQDTSSHYSILDLLHATRRTVLPLYCRHDDRTARAVTTKTVEHANAALLLFRYNYCL